MSLIKNLMNNPSHSAKIDFSLLLLRIAAGGFMMKHGYAKFLRMMDGNFNFANPIGIGEEASLVLVVFAELICAAFILLGILPRLATIPLIITMLVVIFLVHDNIGLAENELAYFFLISYFVILMCGAGRYSIQSLISK